MRLSDRVFLTLSGDSGCSLSHPSDCNAYAVDCGAEVVLIDAGVGVGSEEVLKNLEKDGVEAARISTLLSDPCTSRSLRGRPLAQRRACAEGCFLHGDGGHHEVGR